MKASELIEYLIAYLNKYGDVEVTGECEICQNSGMGISMMTNDFDKTISIKVGESEAQDE